MFTTKDFADFLGVEMGEEFQLCDDDGVYASVYRVTKDGLEYLKDDTWKYQFDMNDLVGKSVKKLPWKPRNGDKYWYVDIDGTPSFDTFSDEDIFSLGYYACKNCFRTEDEAKAHVDSVINYMQSIYKCGREEVITDPRFMARLLFKFCMKNTCAMCPFAAGEEGKLCHIGEPHKWTYEKGGSK